MVWLSLLMAWRIPGVAGAGLRGQSCVSVVTRCGCVSQSSLTPRVWCWARTAAAMTCSCTSACGKPCTGTKSPRRWGAACGSTRETRTAASSPTPRTSVTNWRLVTHRDLVRCVHRLRNSSVCLMKMIFRMRFLQHKQILERGVSRGPHCSCISPALLWPKIYIV